MAEQFIATDFKPIQKGDSLRGFFVLHLPSGMVIYDVSYHRRNDGSRWIGLPAKAYEVAGEKKWTRLIDFETKETHQRFQAAALAAIDTLRLEGA